MLQVEIRSDCSNFFNTYLMLRGKIAWLEVTLNNVSATVVYRGKQLPSSAAVLSVKFQNVREHYKLHFCGKVTNGS